MGLILDSVEERLRLPFSGWGGHRDRKQFGRGGARGVGGCSWWGHIPGRLSVTL